MMTSYQVTIYRLSAIGYNIEIVVLCCYSYTMSSSPYITMLVQYHWPLKHGCYGQGLPRDFSPCMLGVCMNVSLMRT